MLPFEFGWRLFEVLGMICAAALWGFKQQADKSKRDAITDAKFIEMGKEIVEQQERSEDIVVRLQKIQDQVNRFPIMELEIEHLKNENRDLKHQNLQLLQKLDQIWAKMNQIELTLKDKVNRS